MTVFVSPGFSRTFAKAFSSFSGRVTGGFTGRTYACTTSAPSRSPAFVSWSVSVALGPSAPAVSVGCSDRVLEARVAQAVAEREERLDGLRVVPAVADEEPLVVPDLAALAGELAGEARRVRGGVGELSSGTCRAACRTGSTSPKSDRGERGAGLGAAVPGLQHGRRLREPRGHVDGGAGDQDDDGARVRLDDARDELVLVRGQREVAAVDALVVGEGLVREAADEETASARRAASTARSASSFASSGDAAVSSLVRTPASVALAAAPALGLPVALREDDVGPAAHAREDARRGR